MRFWDFTEEESAQIKRKLLEIDRSQVGILCGIMAQILLTSDEFDDYINKTKGNNTYTKENYHQTLKADKVKMLQELWKNGKTVRDICIELNEQLDDKKKPSFLKLLHRIDAAFSLPIQGSKGVFSEERRIDSLDYGKCLIYYGPPGTGKTRKAKIEAAKLVRDNKELSDSDALQAAKKIMQEKTDENFGQIQMVQFHPSYSYNDFMETIDVTKKGYVDRIFKEFAKRAKEDKEQKPYVLIIDEINRANVSEVLGELLYGLEYREMEFTTGVSNESFSVPNNLYVMGTMNTADKSLQTLDYAVRRRFAFEKVESKKPNPVDGKNEDVAFYKIVNKDGSKQKKDLYFINDVFELVKDDVSNSVARGIMAEDIMPGISYFIVEEDNKVNEEKYSTEHFEYKMNYELIPLLKEYIKDGMFTMRKKISDNKSLIELVYSGKYYNRLKNRLNESNKLQKGEQ